MKNYILIILLLPFCCFSQKFESEIRVTYLLESKDEKNSDKKNSKTYILMANKDFSIYKPAITYVFDSLKTKNQNDKTIFEKYYDPKSQNKIFSGNNTDIKVYETKNLMDFAYIEPNSFIWKLTNEKKIISGIECYKATIEIYGRKWIAYYAPDYPFSFGPYKFGRLPGLIIELRDSNNEFIFTTKKIIKYKGSVFIDDSKVNFLSKKDFFSKIINQLSFDTTMGGQFKLDAQTQKEIMVREEYRLKNLNFIENVPETQYK